MTMRKVIIKSDQQTANLYAAFTCKLTDSEQYLASLLMERGDAYLPKNKILDQIVDGNMDASGLENLNTEHYSWFEDALEAVDWWRRLSVAALLRDDLHQPNAIFAEQRASLSKLLRDVLNAYVQAHEETAAYSEAWCEIGPKLMDFLRTYRLYTRYVEAFVVQTFPDINPELLLNPNFGFTFRESEAA